MRCDLWAIFLLAAITVAICALLVIYIANKVFIAIKKDQTKGEKEIKVILEQEKTEDKNNG